MYDTVYFRLTKDDVRNVNFLKEIPCYLDDYDERKNKKIGNISKIGILGGLKVSINSFRVQVKNSLCKWYLGNNYKTMCLSDTRQAIERLSDKLHLPFNKATVTRLDVGCNIITNYPPDVYLNHLGMLRYADRLPQPCGLYYYPYCQTICFYDKNKEQKRKKSKIPELYLDKNVLRLELRYIKRIAKQFKVEAVTGEMLYNESFYMNLIDRFAQTFERIDKVNDITLNFQEINGKQQFYMLGVLSMVERFGGEINMINFINEGKKQGKLTSKQAYDLRKVVKDACKENEGLVVKSDVITELEKKIKIALKYYR